MMHLAWLFFEVLWLSILGIFRVVFFTSGKKRGIECLSNPGEKEQPDVRNQMVGWDAG